MKAWFELMILRLARKHWIRRIDKVLSNAYEVRLIDSRVMHLLDDRLKYHPDLPILRIDNDKAAVHWHCKLCGNSWKQGQPKSHAPGCLAAEKKENNDV